MEFIVFSIPTLEKNWRRVRSLDVRDLPEVNFMFSTTCVEWYKFQLLMEQNTVFFICLRSYIFHLCGVGKCFIK